MTMTASPDRPLTVLRPHSTWSALDLRELWQFRELLFTLALRDVKLRYRQTLLGVAWVVLQPLIAAGVLSFVFQEIAHVPSGEVPYFLMTFTGFVAFGLFQSTLTRSSHCLVGNAALVSKVFFPRLILPLSVLPSALLDFAVAGCLAAVLLAVHGIEPGAPLLWLPVWVALLTALGLGVGLAASTLAVSFRDVQHIVPVLSQTLLYASPVAYPLEEVVEHVSPAMRQVYFLNPLVAPVAGLRWSLLGTTPPPPWLVAQSVATAVALLAVGAIVFAMRERRFADVI